ncbi:helix-turn-helix domain-containing protein [Massilimicrobiota timonensis]|uniref:helix-turn-helix domain-containing protein n=1 Tax=Massilimicrobiota timonensis TaxID=1776392 RepID=UPI00101CE9A7|nr:helix-turn-helix transcriptional regulator [Massilimicrobiota timonensis]
MRLKRISDLRTDADLSCAALARIIGVTDRTMLRYEKGETDIPTEILISVADYFNVSVDYLLERTHNKNINR